jgi:hypothetical protein
MLTDLLSPHAVGSLLHPVFVFAVAHLRWAEEAGICLLKVSHDTIAIIGNCTGFVGYLVLDSERTERSMIDVGMLFVDFDFIKTNPIPLPLFHIGDPSLPQSNSTEYLSLANWATPTPNTQFPTCIPDASGGDD